jgi:hypothetical protein
MTWTVAKGHKGPVKDLRTSGPQGLDPLFTHTHYFSELLSLPLPYVKYYSRKQSDVHNRIILKIKKTIFFGTCNRKPKDCIRILLP